MIYIYESHLGGFYISDDMLDDDDLYCDECGSYDDFVCSCSGNDYMTFIESIDIGIENMGGCSPEIVLEFINNTFNANITEQRFIDLVTNSNRYIKREKECEDE